MKNTDTNNSINDFTINIHSISEHHKIVYDEIIIQTNKIMLLDEYNLIMEFEHLMHRGYNIIVEECIIKRIIQTKQYDLICIMLSKKYYKNILANIITKAICAL